MIDDPVIAGLAGRTDRHDAIALEPRRRVALRRQPHRPVRVEDGRGRGIDGNVPRSRAAEPVLVEARTQDGTVRQREQRERLARTARGPLRERATVPAEEVAVLGGDPERAFEVDRESLEAIRRQALRQAEGPEVHAVEAREAACGREPEITIRRLRDVLDRGGGEAVLSIVHARTA
jgi:hypothetical protein